MPVRDFDSPHTYTHRQTDTETYLVMRQHNKCSAPCTLHNDGEELWINSAERRVPGAFTHANIIVALFTFHRLSVDMPKLGASDYTKRHLK